MWAYYQPMSRFLTINVFVAGFMPCTARDRALVCSGPERRLLEDFGYWYEPDGRTEAVQAEFEKVWNPPASEWIIATSAGFPLMLAVTPTRGDFEPDRLAFMNNKVQRSQSGILEAVFHQESKCVSKRCATFYDVEPLCASQFIVK